MHDVSHGLRLPLYIGPRLSPDSEERILFFGGTLEPEAPVNDS